MQAFLSMAVMYRDMSLTNTTYDPYKYYLFTDSEYAAKEHMLPYNPNGYLCPMICTGADRFSGLFVRIEDDLADPEEYAFFVECGGDKFIY